MLPGIEMGVQTGGGSGGSGSLVVSVTPATASRTQGTLAASGNVTSPTVTASASGGQAPYTYAWGYLSGSGDIEATAISSASTAFFAFIPSDTTAEGEWQVIVTDALGQSGSAIAPVYLHLVNVS